MNSYVRFTVTLIALIGLLGHVLRLPAEVVIGMALSAPFAAAVVKCRR